MRSQCADGGRRGGVGAEVEERRIIMVVVVFVAVCCCKRVREGRGVGETLMGVLARRWKGERVRFSGNLKTGWRFA